MSGYRKWENGELINVYDLEECLQSIRVRDTDKDNRIKYLEKINKELTNEAYKDNELQNMKEQLEKMKKDYYRGFPISEAEHAAIKEWKERHDKEVHGVRNDVPSYDRGTGGRYEYIFYPTGIGISGVIRCHCGAEFEFKEIG